MLAAFLAGSCHGRPPARRSRNRLTRVPRGPDGACHSDRPLGWMRPRASGARCTTLRHVVGAAPSVCWILRWCRLPGLFLLIVRGLAVRGDAPVSPAGRQRGALFAFWSSAICCAAARRPLSAAAGLSLHLRRIVASMMARNRLRTRDCTLSSDRRSRARQAAQEISSARLRMVSSTVSGCVRLVGFTERILAPPVVGARDIWISGRRNLIEAKVAATMARPCGPAHMRARQHGFSSRPSVQESRVFLR